MKQCRFCFPLEGKNKSLVLSQTKNFYVLASIGPIIEGYLLVCSKKHYSSCGNLPAKLYPEYNELRQIIKSIFTNKCSGYTFFEHGKTRACAKNGDDRHCFHAHLHALPTQVDILPKLIKELGRPVKISSEEMITKTLGNNPYLFYETQKGKFVWSAPKDLRQQFFRWILAGELGIMEKADWKVNPNWQGAKETYNKLMVNFANF